MEKNKFKLDGKPLVIAQPSPLAARIIKHLDKLKADEFYSLQELAVSINRSPGSIRNISCQSRYLTAYTATMMLGGSRKKIFGSKAGIKQLIASLNTDEAARSRKRS